MPGLLEIADYVRKKENPPLIDVRTPGEFSKGHIPGAINIPLFTDEQRAHIGTVYVQNSPGEAVDVGYKYAHPNKHKYVEQTREVAPDGAVIVHCWRGGMRSNAFADLLEHSGFNSVQLIKGGYKSYRQLARKCFAEKYNFKVLGGFTGSGKTDLLKHLRNQGHQVIDLEGLAHHRGSAFGAVAGENQPSVEQFENNLFEVMNSFKRSKPIFIEDESYSIGGVNLPLALYRQMQAAKLYFFDIPKNQRAQYLANNYGNADIGFLAGAIQRIQKRLGGLRTKQALELLEAGRMKEVAELTLEYYDKSYMRSAMNRDWEKVVKLNVSRVDVELQMVTLFNKLA